MFLIVPFLWSKLMNNDIGKKIHSCAFPLCFLRTKEAPEFVKTYLTLKLFVLMSENIESINGHVYITCFLSSIWPFQFSLWT
jgi:hypothetical protein